MGRLVIGVVARRIVVGPGEVRLGLSYGTASVVGGAGVAEGSQVGREMDAGRDVGKGRRALFCSVVGDGMRRVVSWLGKSWGW